MKRFLATTRLWILALSLACSLFGAASNQLVLAANHDKFPVMLNARKLAAITQADNTPVNSILTLLGVEPPAQVSTNDDGMLDDIHCVMTKATHLNFLADWIDLQNATYSPGDMLLELGSWTWGYAPVLWGFLMCSDALQRKREFATQLP